MDAAPATHAIAAYPADTLQSRTSPTAAVLAVDLPPDHNTTAPPTKDIPFGVSETTAAGPAPPSSRALLQSLVACWTGSVCLGTSIGYAGPAWRSLKGDPHFGDIDPFWFHSLGLVGAVGGSVVGSLSAQAIGRRRTMAVNAIGALCTWLCVGCAQEVWYLYTGRFVNGFFAGMLSLVVPAQIAELADARNRGVQGARHFIGMLIGSIYIGQRDSAMAMQRTLRKDPIEANAEFKLMERAFSRTPTPSLHYWLATHIMFSQQFCGANMAATCASVVIATAGVYADKEDADLAIFITQAVELTPLRGHGVEFGSVCTFHWACAFCSVTFFERVRLSFSFGELAWFYGTLTLANGLVLYYFMPETKHLPLESILLDECPIENSVPVPVIG
ncbi:hypothetical protein HPB52_009441 [Rhipicephalus sanguineus]|uniref:Sugar transporter n=1 Tax=Rhipicephalus sanguineus TaxID=34632 RepID=A0A9D4PVH9_RHISA|nr:hypothetical protein HPB52_009441 [Rhipicephalus sanguineus]